MAVFYTFLQAKQELQYRLGNRTDLGSGSQDRLSLWLDVAQIQVSSCVISCETLDVVSFPLTTVQGQTEYSLQSILPPATNVIGLRDLRNNTTGNKMRRFDWQEYRSLNQQAQGQPLRWARLGYILAFDPQPDNEGPYTIFIDYRREPQRGISELPNRFQDSWITAAEWIGWKALLKPERAQAAFALLPAQLQTMLARPLDWDQWDAMWDNDLGIRPLGFEYPYLVGP
jgi:hypothetical protein